MTEEEEASSGDVRQNFIEKINKQYKGEVAQIGGDFNALNVKRLRSGALSLDLALGGGWPFGRICLLAGEWSTGKTLYILDEPTTGLSFEDIAALLVVLQRLVDAGNTVIVIEHHLDVIKNADYVIDLGPGAGDKGGYVIATGTPEEIFRVKTSATGQYLGRVLPEDIECALTS